MQHQIELKIGEMSVKISLKVLEELKLRNIHMKEIWKIPEVLPQCYKWGSAMT
jgi:hypothetical protein